MMIKIPKIFLPDKSLENKIKDFLRPKTLPKTKKKYISGERKIWIYYKNNKELPSGGIYVHVRHPSSKNGCSLDVYSDCRFYAPSSDYDWKHKKRISQAKAFAKNDTMLFKFLWSLKYHNKGTFLWEDHEKILGLKKRYEEKWGIL